jgi:hypothetical protein
MAGLFAGKPAPTGIAPSLNAVLNLWERVYPRRGQHGQKTSQKQKPNKFKPLANPTDYR